MTNANERAVPKDPLHERPSRGPADARRQRAEARTVLQRGAVDPDVRDCHMLAMHRGGRRSIAQIAGHAGLTAREVREGIDRALQIEGCSLPDFAWEQAAPPQSARWAWQPLE